MSKIQYGFLDDIIDRYSDLPSDKKLLFICEVGARSGLAAEYASSMGSDNSDLYNIDERNFAVDYQDYPILKMKK